jgi:hypothetical protein
MGTKPRSLELCHKVIEKLEKDNAMLSDTLHKLANEAQAALIEKDRQMVEKCRLCRRRIR